MARKNLGNPKKVSTKQPLTAKKGKSVTGGGMEETDTPRRKPPRRSGK